MICLKCNNDFNAKITIDNKIRDLSNRKYCLNCSPFKSKNTQQLHLIDENDIICRWHLCNNTKKIGSFCSKQCSNKFGVSQRRKKLKILSLKYKGNECLICGYSKCSRSLDFHHLDPIKKDFAISKSGITKSWAKVKIELDKCILVCKNCHGEIHSEEYSYEYLFELSLKQNQLHLIETKKQEKEEIHLQKLNQIEKEKKVKLKTKKQTACDNCGIIRNYIGAAKLCKICVKDTILKFQITPSELEKLVWEKPTSEIAKEFGVSDNAIGKRCKKHNINKPPRGYWQKINPYQNKIKGA